jgi:predicted dehydrogenase
MDSRRSFVKKLGKGAVLSSFALSSVSDYASRLTFIRAKSNKLIRIGIIGAENSHSIEYGKIFNIEKKFPGVEVRYIWGETEEFARNAMKEGSIPELVKDPGEMMGKIDALIVDHRHPRYHLPAAEPFVKAGIPTFIDKPFCYRMPEGKAFLAMAHTAGTPVTSYSMISQSNATYDIKEQVASIGEISHIISCGPADLDSIYGGIFFYGIHIIQPLMTIFGGDIKKVRVTRNGKTTGASLVFGNGRLATLVFKTLSGGWETFIESKNGIVELKSRVQEPDPGKNYADMVEMFRTGKEPLNQNDILGPIAVLEALEKSAVSDTWEEVMSIV